jgi:hypothetical protein
MKMKLVTILLFLQGLVSALQAQQDSNVQRYRNIIEISFSYSTCLIGRVFEWDHEVPTTKPHYFCPGVTFTRAFKNNKLGLEISYRRYAGGYNGLYIEPNINGLRLYSPGDINHRISRIYSVGLQYKLISRKCFQFISSADIAFRRGFEDMVLGNFVTSGGWPELRSIYMRQNDLGLSLGTRFTWFPHRRIAVSTDWRYTRFVLRYYQPDPRYSWDKGTTKNLLMAQFKVGFCF